MTTLALSGMVVVRPIDTTEASSARNSRSLTKLSQTETLCSVLLELLLGWYFEKRYLSHGRPCSCTDGQHSSSRGGHLRKQA